MTKCLWGLINERREDELHTTTEKGCGSWVQVFGRYKHPEGKFFFQGSRSTMDGYF